MSIEQLQDFHQVRRILRAVAPEFRTLATSNLSPGDYVVDVFRKTIEVGERADIKEAVSCLLFGIGHVLLLDNEKYGLLFGKGLAEWNGSEEDLIENLAELGESADGFASKWAADTLQAYWQIEESEATQRVAALRMNKDEWKKYFSE